MPSVNDLKDLELPSHDPDREFTARMIEVMDEIEETDYRSMVAEARCDEDYE